MRSRRITAMRPPVRCYHEGMSDPVGNGGAGGGDGPARQRSSIDDIIDVYKRDVDRTLLREQLRKTPDERVRELAQLERFADKLRDAVRRAGA